MNNAALRRPGKLTAAAIGAALAVSIPLTVWASHQFTDVPTGHPFHGQISAVADAGITTGFPDGGFHPGDPITRQAMAAFLERGLGRVGMSSTAGDLPLAPTTNDVLTEVFIDAGATGGGAGFVVLIGTAWFKTTAPADCPCWISLDVVDLQAGTSLASTEFDVGGAASEGGTALGTGTVQAVARVTGNSTRQFGLRAFLHDSTGSMSASGSLSAQYMPFGPDGDDTLPYGFCSAPAEGEPNDSIPQARRLDAGQPMDACIEPVGDEDYFMATVPAGTDWFLTAKTTGLDGPGTCDTDTVIKIWNSSDTVVAQDDDSGPGSCSTVDWTRLDGGTYYLEVSGKGGTTTGSYQIEYDIL
jgi:hypothetical protein